MGQSLSSALSLTLGVPLPFLGPHYLCQADLPSPMYHLSAQEGRARTETLQVAPEALHRQKKEHLNQGSGNNAPEVFREPRPTAWGD